MEKVLTVLKVNLKYNIFPFALSCIFMMVAAPLFVGTENLMEYQVARIAELYIALFGVIMLIPVFAPEMNRDIKDLLYSKKTHVFILHIIRILQSVVLLSVFCAAFLLYLKWGKCNFSFIKIFYTVMANSVFLGGIGMLVFALSDQIVFAYMLPLVYYAVNFGMKPDKLGKFYLFSMQMGKLEIKHWLLAVGLAAMVVAVVVRHVITRGK